ncbi:MAG: hypothetical protein EPN82_16675 [Bacteroidetes bacterium]|nr:MAG: hypothetical protein EPN82_16675 [Bacteroidota bacterium]
MTALEKPEYDLYTHICFKPGLYYDNTEELSNILAENGFPEIKPENVYYIGFNYASNHLPFPFYHIPNIFMSFDLRIPFERTVENGNRASSLKTYAFFLELEGFHDLINNIAIYPIIGFGCSITHLDLRNDSSIDFKDFITKAGNSRFTKFNLLLNLGGGMDYKINLTEDYKKKINFIVGLNIRYSLNLDVFGMYDKRWSSAGKSINGLPDYHAPGLSIELKFGLEKLEKIK